MSYPTYDYTFEQYAEEARVTANKPTEASKLNWALGLAGETGEVCDEIKKVVFHGKTLDVDTLKLELGDILWYLNAIAVEFGLTLEMVAKANILKLERRHRGGFKTHAEQWRDEQSGGAS